MTNQLFLKFAKDDALYRLYGGDDFAQYEISSSTTRLHLLLLLLLLYHQVTYFIISSSGKLQATNWRFVS